MNVSVHRMPHVNVRQGFETVAHEDLVVNDPLSVLCYSLSPKGDARKFGRDRVTRLWTRRRATMAYATQ